MPRMTDDQMTILMINGRQELARIVLDERAINRDICIERDEAIAECVRLTALNNKLTEDFNTLALDRSRWQGLAKDALDLGKSTAKKLQDAQDALASLRSMLELGPSALPVRGSLPSGESDLPVT